MSVTPSKSSAPAPPARADPHRHTRTLQPTTSTGGRSTPDASRIRSICAVRPRAAPLSGTGVSGGQRARVALARALLIDAPALILDETLAPLDAHAEAALRAMLRQRAPDRVTLVVTHRTATIRAADRVLVLHNGRVEEHAPSGRPTVGQVPNQ
ncbi:ATP-binding cassette domain-containing protein [Plantactinospora sp. CA-290183]|uniref:ATP-binding cassette domain-containing protein n=1 Tax=Plantactinospora sp. CA-290183 TaxID=3240006 RepID=UPI003D8FF212